MYADSLRKFLICLGIAPDDIKMTSNGWLQSPCPLAEWTHGSGIDEHPSFYAKENSKGPSGYKCFGCELQGGLRHLLHVLFLHSGEHYIEASSVYMQDEIFGKEEPDGIQDWFVDPTEQFQEFDVPDPLPKKVLRQYPLLQDGSGYEHRRCVEWLRDERGVSEYVQNLTGMRYDAANSTVIFPLTGMDGEIYLFRARKRKSKTIWTIDEKIAGCPDLKFARPSRFGMWFNLRNVDWTKPVLLLEGELDCGRAIELGYANTIASATSSVTTAQLNALQGDTYILGYDDDKSGWRAHDKIKNHLDALMYEIKWGVVERKDAGALVSREEFKKAWKAAKRVEF